MPMRRFLHYMIFALALTCAPLAVNASESGDQIETETQNPSVTLNDAGAIVVKNAEHLVLEIFAVTGEKVLTQRIDSNSKVIEVAHLNNGCYIVRVGKVTKKVYLHS